MNAADHYAWNTPMLVETREHARRDYERTGTPQRIHMHHHREDCDDFGHESIPPEPLGESD